MDKLAKSYPQVFLSYPHKNGTYPHFFYIGHFLYLALLPLVTEEKAKVIHILALLYYYYCFYIYINIVTVLYGCKRRQRGFLGDNYKKYKIILDKKWGFGV